MFPFRTKPPRENEVHLAPPRQHLRALASRTIPCILSWESDGGPEKGPFMLSQEIIHGITTNPPSLACIFTMETLKDYIYIVKQKTNHS